jgi:hypothetical protein
MKRLAVAAVAVLAVSLVATGSGDIGVQLITTTAHPGQIARLQGPAGMPLYVVTASRAPQPYPCGKNAICAPRSTGPPHGWPYVRLRVLSRTSSGVIRFRVPALLAGQYRAVVYCEPCYRGPTGSLIVSGNRMTVHD